MQINDRGAFYSGTSGIVLPVPNKEFFPPEFREKSRLEYYASLFNSVEINSSFYKVPMPSTVRKWAESVPENFRFTFKFWRNITHNKDLDFQKEDVFKFMKTIHETENRKGCLLVQFPPSLKIQKFSALQRLVETIREADPDSRWKTVLEFRHRSWYQEDVYELTEQWDMGIVMHDKPGSQTPASVTPESFRYLRFHGPDGNYKGNYADDLLQDYAELIRQWIGEGKQVYSYFNNTMGNAVQNLESVNHLV